jgi:hypothetical protein
MPKSKMCSRCKVDKTIEDFTKDNHQRDGLRAACKSCSKETKDKYRNKPESKKKEKEAAIAWRRSNPTKFMLYCAKSRAKRDDVPFSIGYEDIVVPDVCPILGIRIFQNLDKGTHGPSANSPSLDKIVPELGYVVGNIQVISNRANTMKQDASLDEIIALGKWAQAQKDKVYLAK